MENDLLLNYISKEFPNYEVNLGKQYVEIRIDASQITTVSSFLSKDEKMKFDYLICESAVDYLTYFEMVYHLESTFYRHQIVVKAKIEDRNLPIIETVYSYWKSAEYHEREIFDLMGISFTNHPDLRKIFLDADWVGFPLRKDYIDEVNIVER